ncbi:glycosyl hydrolase [Draconibacterium sp. IB214405]|uniref:glycosyl hydrolase n=1 Tax=Draconibacterium sp. IB214405 TaxID=3097352 RepID=UPI002A0C1A92|nr:glycosyl hydrolase [Draconibacterium sp. IB214405]MDX8339400.1 glycosyl hydrolase [Draconibacterium sp. IB214405]
MFKKSFAGFLIVVSLLVVQCERESDLQTQNDNLEEGFINPPNEAQPRVWWHWMNGNVTKDGIRKDLEWMHRNGIGGFQNFDAGMTTPKIVDERLVYMTPAWKDAFRFTTELADSLGLEMAIAGSPGWSESGGPWVKPEEAMKKVIWSELRVEGGQTFSGELPHPPTNSGTFQNMGAESALGAVDSEHHLTEYYKDISVIAYPLPYNDISMEELQPKITSSGGNFSLAQLTDGDLVTSSELAYKKPGEFSWIQFEFNEPTTIQSVTIVTGGGRGQFNFGGGGPASQNLEVSNDGTNFEKVIDIRGGRTAQKSLAFAPVTGKYFRVNIITPQPSRGGGMMAMMGLGGGNQPAPTGTAVMELVLNTGARVNRFEDKAGFATATDLEQVPTPETSEAVSTENIIDLTAQMAEDGSLNWEVPEGKWNIIRLGFSLTGRENHPASPEATGFEVDKLNAQYVRNYFTNYLDQYKDATGGLMGEHGLQYIITDSWEAGTQNWTDNMPAEFKNRRGYELFPWLPALTGKVIESAQATDKFLWDYRRTLEELVAEYHYDQSTELLAERGMGRYSESHEGGRALIADGMEVKRTAAVPMSATWTPGGFGGPGPDVAIRHKADVRESASVSHIYGQKYVAAESLTAIGTAWAWSPRLLKPVADAELASGLNRFVIHTSVHQPVDDRIPGLGLGPFGQWFTRHETWAEQAIAWTTYLARSSYMLQQGNFVADVAYMYGESHNITELFGGQLPLVPKGYEYDFINADALLNALKVEEGKITSPGGAAYKLLVLDKSTAQMTLPVLLRIKDMATAGAVICGPKPIGTPSLSDDADQFSALADELWPIENGVNTIGKGKIYNGYPINEVLEKEQIATDFSYTKPDENTELLYVHRRIGDTDFYWVNNRSNREEEVEATFRVEGKEAEIWQPETGMIKKASYSITNGITTVPLHLAPNDAVFVVFRNKTQTDSFTVPEVRENKLADVTGPWEVGFESKVGEPFSATFETLSAWNENADNNIKYFSGAGTYTKTIDVPAEWLNEGGNICLDLGEVENLAEVSVNGKEVGIVWKKPFRLEIGSALQEGANEIEIKVVNLWVNRLIGDAQTDVTEKLTYTTMPFYQANSPLKTSGLLGPVVMVRTK